MTETPSTAPNLLRQFLSSVRVHDKLQSDFIYDALEDDTLPDARSWTELRAHLYSLRACREAIISAAALWRRYRKEVLNV